MLGKLHLTYDEMYYCSLRTNANRIRGHYKSIEEQSHDAWERERYFALAFINTQLKHAIKKPVDLVRFPWEPKPKQMQLTPEQFKALIKNG